MNALRNKVQLIGRLGQDPDIKTLESGKKVVHFTMATNENYKSADGSKTEEATWHNIVAGTGREGLISNSLKKGGRYASRDASATAPTPTRTGCRRVSQR